MSTLIRFLGAACLWLLQADAQIWNYDARSRDWGGQCANGTFQSPIDIRLEGRIQAPRRSPVILEYSSNAQLRTERTVLGVEQVAIPLGSNITINGSNFRAISAHWHSPAEHALNGSRAVLELHIVHNDFENKLAVLSVSYKRGSQPDPLLQLFLDNLPPHVPQGQNSTGPSFGPADLQSIVSPLLPAADGNDGFFASYNGSLTTPPCTEGVRWYISTKLAPATDTQLLSFQTSSNGGNTTLSTNSRPLNPIAPSMQVEPI